MLSLPCWFLICCKAEGIVVQIHGQNTQHKQATVKPSYFTFDNHFTKEVWKMESLIKSFGKQISYLGSVIELQIQISLTLSHSIEMHKVTKAFQRMYSESMGGIPLQTTELQFTLGVNGQAVSHLLFFEYYLLLFTWLVDLTFCHKILSQKESHQQIRKFDWKCSQFE